MKIILRVLLEISSSWLILGVDRAIWVWPEMRKVSTMLWTWVGPTSGRLEFSWEGKKAG
jgi:hypothetical protein